MENEALASKIEDMSRAVEELLENDILAHVGLQSLPDPDDLRRSTCYTVPVVGVLKRHHDTLKALFTGIAGGQKQATFGLDQWMAFLRSFELIGKDVSERDAIRCFAWSRMCVVDGLSSAAGFAKENKLPFEGMCEALIRLSIMKALPDPEDVAESGCDDIRAYLQWLQTSDRAYEKFVDEQSTPWGESPREPPPHERIDQLVTYMVVVVESASSSTSNSVGDQKITDAELQKWMAAKGAKMQR